MDDRRITATGKDRDGDIIRVCNSGAYWSPRNAVDVIRDIDTGLHTYYVRNGAGRSDVHVSSTSAGRRYLRTDPNGACTDNLDTLPDC